MRTRQIGALLALVTAIGAAPAAAQVCGDGIVTPPEPCDDGNLFAGDGCSPLCLFENLPPDCGGAFASVEDLWPPNHKLVPITVDGVVDPDGDPVALVVTAVAQDEPVDDVGDGATCPDAVGVGTDGVELRSERQGPGDGRVYHVAFVATDPFGAACGGTVFVCVRHDNGRGSTCGDGGPLYDSAVGDPLLCGGDAPVCDIDTCIPDDDDLAGCTDDLPRSVLRKTSRARVVLARAAATSRPARRSRLGKRAVRLLTRAESRASVALDAACGDYVASVLTAARDCAACATDVP